MSHENRCFLESHGSGIPVVFLHGYPLNRSMWNDQVPAIATSFRPILIDLPGFGSAARANKSDTPSLAKIADEVFEALQSARITEPIVLVGLSMGGYIALEFWKRHASSLRGLVLADTKASPDTPEAAEARYKTAKTALEEGTEKAVNPMMAKLISAQSQKSEKITTWLQKTMHSVSPETIEMALYAMAGRSDFTNELSSINVPTLVIAGREDAIIPVEVMKKMADAIPGASFKVVEGSGHMPSNEQPDAFNQLLLDFLQTV